MSLGLIGEYDSDDSSTETPPPSATITSPPKRVQHSTDSVAPNDNKSYFEDTYSGDSDTSTEDESTDDEPLQEGVVSPHVPLPLPDLQRVHSGQAEAIPGSVFSNPYLEEEDAKLAVLKKHVTLAPTEEPDKEKQQQRRMRRKRFDRAGEHNDQGLFNDQDSSIRRKKINKVRTGLSQGLVPSQKYMKLHKKQQADERPWTLK